MKTIVQFGAGNIGRSLVGQLFSLAGYEVIFVDAVDSIVNALNEKREYKVVIKDTIAHGEPDTIEVKNVRAIHAFNTEAVANAVGDADMLATAVGPMVLPKLAPTIAKGLAKRTTPISMIMCENLRNAANIMRAKIIENLPPCDFDPNTMLGLVETSIGKMVPIMPIEVTKTDPLVIWAEKYNQIIADRRGFIGEAPQVKGLVLKENFTAYVDRKLFIHNLGHATSAYFGFLKGKTFIWECMEDPTIRQSTRSVMMAAARALIERYPSEFNEANQAAHVEDLLSRFANKVLNDTVFRVGRDLYRKLSAEDRCVAALRLVSQLGGDVDPICKVIAAGLRFKAVDETGKMFADDEKFQAQLSEKGVEKMLEEVSGLDPQKDRRFIDVILEHYDRLG